MNSKRYQESTEKYLQRLQLIKKLWEANNAVINAAGTDEVYPAIQKAENIIRRLNEISSSMKMES